MRTPNRNNDPKPPFTWRGAAFGRALTVTVVLATAACSQPTPDEEPAAPVSEESPLSVPTEEPVNSILRDDMSDPPITPPPMKPLDASIPFAEGGTKLTEAAQQAVKEILASEQFKAGGAIVLRGHTDSKGADDANLRASRRRAEAVAEAFADAGADPERFTIIPIGEMRPVAPNAHLDGTPDEAGRARNRRVDVTVKPPPDREGATTETPQASGAVAPENGGAVPVDGSED